MTDQTKQCHECLEVKPISDFNTCARRKSGFQHRCRPCQKAAKPERAKRPEGYVLPDSKACTKCKIDKPLNLFSLNKANYDGRQSQCNDCSNAQRRAFSKTEDGQARLKVWETKARLKFRYGITPEIYEAVNLAQNGLCAICDRPPQGGKKTKGLCIDHGHTTGKFRGLICHRCNTAIGTFGDSIEGLQRALAYLRSHAESSTESSCSTPPSSA